VQVPALKQTAFIIVALMALLAGTPQSQTKPVWPDIQLSACPDILPVKSLSEHEGMVTLNVTVSRPSRKFKIGRKPLKL
jgi:hypothetical protein